ncbi:hypothetical protein N0V88_000145 [Collariella sp. IMI 366227]|nr:hypothetical protein N0V88_000145 [Collariella sp. IMI 366227]
MSKFPDRSTVWPARPAHHDTLSMSDDRVNTLCMAPFNFSNLRGDLTAVKRLLIQAYDVEKSWSGFPRNCDVLTNRVHDMAMWHFNEPLYGQHTTTTTTTDQNPHSKHTAALEVLACGVAWQLGSIYPPHDE